jgi:exo-1,4-beta-D-glucosaminidase
MIWHLYDYYLRPGGGYYGTKKACEPLHVQYSYDDRSIVVVNDTQQPAKGLKVTAAVYDVNMTQKHSVSATIDSPADSVTRTLVVPNPEGLTTPTYFLRLTLADGAAKEISRNFYWLSTKEDVLDWANTKWYYTPTKVHADLRAIEKLPQTDLRLRFRSIRTPGTDGGAIVSVVNTGKVLAFQVRLKALDGTGEEILPVYWEDNYIALMPGESRELHVTWPAGAVAARVEAAGWNTKPAVASRE